MRFPYGIADFEKIREGGHFYVDRTDRIALVEEAGNQLLFLRPRRFGKSLWLSTLENYYDLARADAFARLFNDLKIGRNPTPLRNSYFMLKLNFSLVDPGGDHAAIRRSLFDHVNTRIENFVMRYGSGLEHTVRIDRDNAVSTLQSLLGVISQTSHRLYLLIDEYDNFANEVMISPLRGRDRYEELVRGEGTIKTFFKAVKDGAEGRGIDRVFLTGVSPVVLSDITSGYNVGEDLSADPGCHDLCGFTEGEVGDALEKVASEQGFDTHQVTTAMDLMRSFYNGYSFDPQRTDRLYNPTLALYFLKYLSRHGTYPPKLLDENLAVDRNRIQYVARLPHGETLVNRALNTQEPLTVAQLSNRFGVQDMLTAPRDSAFFASLLYYFGVLTLDGRNAMGKLKLAIPNQVIRKLYVERLQEQLLPGYTEQEERLEVVERFYTTGDIEPLCDFIEQRHFKVFDNRDLRWSNELVVKTAFLTTLFNDAFYVMDSEHSIERRYGDLFLKVRPDMRRYALLDHLLEFKVVSHKDAGMTGEELKATAREALREIPVVAEKLQKAREQVNAYGRMIEDETAGTLKPRKHALVCIGLERLVW